MTYANTLFCVFRMGSPSELINRKGVFCEMLQKTGEYEELAGLIQSK